MNMTPTSLEITRAFLRGIGENAPNSVVITVARSVQSRLWL
jgi:hypothetical protein